ncbi:TPA: tetratricopeptide repeat protein [Candidatus Poribacteria bacterium]|nr:tetratricopeptide repeat protein [Candidatus Poribacteria bacterium]
MKIDQKLEEGIAFHQANLLHQAEQVYQEILQVLPQHADALHLLGVIAYQEKEHQIAANLITQAIKIDSTQYSFFNNLGLVLKGQEKLDQAVQAFHQSIEINPRFTEGHNNLGIVLQKQDKLNEAIQAYRWAIEIKPDNIEACYNLGKLLQQKGQLDEAIQVFRRAIEHHPNDAEMYYHLGTTLHKQERLQQAAQAYRQAIELQSSHAEAHYNLGLALQEQEQFDQAVQIYQQAIAFQPNFIDPYNNLGVLLKKQRKFDQAIQVYLQAIEIAPDNAETHNNLGVIFQELGELEESVQSYYQAIKINPQFAEAHKNLGISLLLKGEFDDGWKHYEWRDKCDDFLTENRIFPQPAWNGSNIEGKSILVWAEQGIGDQIMFASIFEDLLKTKADTIVECERRLIPLFQRSFPQIDFVPQENPTQPRLLNSNINYHVPMGGLGRWFRTEERSFLSNKNFYLYVCPEKTPEIRSKYRKLADGKILVGISWKSTSIDQTRADTKSTSLENWKPILSKQDCFFINLQYGDVRQEIEEYTSDQSNISIYLDGEIDPLKNLDDFAAQVSTLDLVISIDNTTVHMAGALGKKVWTLLPYVPDWRWMLKREDTPWYSSMKLFRQTRMNDWSDVFQQVSLELNQYISDYCTINSEQTM